MDLKITLPSDDSQIAQLAAQCGRILADDRANTFDEAAKRDSAHMEVIKMRYAEFSNEKKVENSFALAAFARNEGLLLAFLQAGFYAGALSVNPEDQYWSIYVQSRDSVVSDWLLKHAQRGFLAQMKARQERFLSALPKKG